MRGYNLRSRLSIFLAFLLFFPLLSGGCKHLGQYLKPREPKVKFKRVAIKKISFDSLDVEFFFDVYNPNEIGIEFSSLEYQLDIDGSTLFRGRQNRGLSLKPKGRSELALPFGIVFQKFVKSMVSFFQSKDDVPYRISLKLGFQLPIIGQLVVPVEKRGRLPVPKLPKIEMGNVELVSISPMGAELKFQLKVSNPNRFPIRLRGLKYRIEIANSSLLSGSSRLPLLPARGRRSVEIPLNISFLNAGFAIVNAIRSRNISFLLDGYLDLGLFKLPFKINSQKRL